MIYWAIPWTGGGTEGLDSRWQTQHEPLLEGRRPAPPTHCRACRGPGIATTFIAGPGPHPRRPSAPALDPGTQRQVAWTVALADPSRLPADLGRLAQAMPRLAPGEEESAAGASLAAAAAPRKGAADEEEGAAVERNRRARKKRVRLPKG